MRQICISLLLFIGGSFVFSQPVLENVYSNSGNLCALETCGDKYYIMDIINKQCKIYNMDHSVYKTINLTVPENYWLYNIQFVSQHLFNQDDLVELVYTSSQYIPTETSYYYLYESRLINENGTELLNVPGAGYTEIIQTAASGSKFLVYTYDYSVFPASYQTRVYSLPELPLKSENISDQSYILGLPFPNPSAGNMSLPVNLPEGLESGTFRLFDSMGKLLQTIPVDRQAHTLQMPPGKLTPGAYYYNIESGNFRSGTNKIIIR